MAVTDRDWTGLAMSTHGLLTVLSPTMLAQDVATECGLTTGGFLGQPGNTVSSLAFVVAGMAIAVGNRGERTSRHLLATLVAATGVGSLIQHGPNPSWADLAHDLPLVAVIAFVAVDAAADVVGRRLPAAWWIVPTMAVVPVTVAAPLAGDLTQAAMAAVTVGLWLQRAWARPERRAIILASVSLLGVGALIGTLSRVGWPLCDPDGPLQGHAVWHVLAAAALWRLTPVLGRLRERAPSPMS